MICKKAKEKLKRIEIEWKKTIEERDRKNVEKSEMMDCLKQGVCPRCGSSVSSKINFFQNIFDWLINQRVIHYNCYNCGLKRKLVESIPGILDIS